MDVTLASTQPPRSSTRARAGVGARRPVNSATSSSACTLTSARSVSSDAARYERESGSLPATRRAMRPASGQSIGSGRRDRCGSTDTDTVSRPGDP